MVNQVLVNTYKAENTTLDIKGPKILKSQEVK